MGERRHVFGRKLSSTARTLEHLLPNRQNFLAFLGDGQDGRKSTNVKWRLLWAVLIPPFQPCHAPPPSRADCYDIA
jgi:hypothetical protein